jgi:hypothetical protein
MNLMHDIYDNDSLDCLMIRAYISSQAVKQSDRTSQRITTLKKEMIMRSHGQATLWGTHIEVGRARSGAGWYRQLRQWWDAHKAAREQAKLRTLNACWDAQREAVRPLQAETAADMVAAQHAFSTAIRLSGLAI